MLDYMMSHIVTVRLALRSALVVLLVPLCISGCASARLDEAAWQDQGLRGVWPQAPEKGRIKLLKVIQGPQDIVAASSGVVKRVFDYIAGTREEYIDFFTPQCIAADGNGLIFIADPSIGVVHRYSLADKEIQYIFQAGDKRLSGPVGVALDKDGNLYVTDSQVGAIYKYSADGVFIRELDGKGNLQRPAGIAIKSNGDKVVADALADKVFVFGKDDLFKGELTGADFKESFNKPTYLAVDNHDYVYVTDTMNFTIRVFDADGRYVRNQGQIGDAPGSFARPKGVALDSDRNLYVVDSIFGNFQIFNQKGQLLLYVGQEGSLPGEMMLPSGIFIDQNDRVYVSDAFNHRIQIYQYLKEKVSQ